MSKTYTAASSGLVLKHGNSPFFEDNVDPAVARRHHCPLGINDPNLTCETCPYRRVIIVEINNDYGKRLSGKQLLLFNTARIPIYSIDINTKTGEILNAKKVEKATAWKDVPTPAI